MKHGNLAFFFALSIVMLCSGGLCAAVQAQDPAGPEMRVLAVETFLADIAQNVAGDRFRVAALLPVGADPHSFQATPADVGKVTNCNVLIVHGAGIEEFLKEVLDNAGGARRVIEASTGLKPRTTKEGEAVEAHGEHVEQEANHKHEHGPKAKKDHKHEHGEKHGAPHSRNEGHTQGEGHHGDHHHHDADPHFWLSPINVITYVTNIRDGLSRADPSGATAFTANADAYIAQLKELDRWIAEQVKQIPENKRILVTNHESLGYFADRYGFQIAGSILPSVSTGASPSAREMAMIKRRVSESNSSQATRDAHQDIGSLPSAALQSVWHGVCFTHPLYTRPRRRVLISVHAIPSKKGIQESVRKLRIPAFVGMTNGVFGHPVVWRCARERL
jgi:ABC-type Zn uptake system ZnuABC Zn-binding protein ZnuA